MRYSLVLSLILALACLGAAGPYANLDKRLKDSKPSLVEQEVRQSGLGAKDATLAELLDAPGKTEAQRSTGVRDYVSMRSLFESNRPKTATTPISEIKKSGLYRKPADEGGDNWVSRALERIRFNVNPPTPKAPPKFTGIDGLGFLVYVVWGVLAIVIALLLFFAIRYFRWKINRQRALKSTAMLEDDEPERSLDEWLELSAQLESEGRFREAVRCLYVACLLRYDEHRVARFDRTQTNWEHYRRIQASPTNPKAFELLGLTTDFDHIWYGFRPTSAVEVQRFRASYQELTGLLANRMAGAR